jgi:hypothetical protein
MTMNLTTGRVRTFAILVVLTFCPALAAAYPARVEPLEMVSGESPFTGCTADRIFNQTGQNYPDSEVEPWVAVNPVDPLNVVGTWQQDRWSNGGARGLSVGVSFDGGMTWESVVVPGLTLCSGGPWRRASDPWLSFAPNGDLYHIALVFDVGSRAANGMAVTRSIDGGLTWGDPVELVQNGFPFFHDKQSITADPTDANAVYAVWDRLDRIRDRGPAVFTRTLDGGQSWDPIRTIHDPGRFNQTVNNQIVVLPDGTILDFFTEIFGAGPQLGRSILSFRSSSDKGTTWSPAGGAAQVHDLYPQNAVDPELGKIIRDGAYLFDVAVDPRNGALYAVWQTGIFTGFQIPSIAFTMSRDGGGTWSAPISVNAAPADLDPLERQAFLPSVHAAETGMVGISYYDFRLDGEEPSAFTDHWFTACHPRAADCTDPAKWEDEVRVTEDSFDILEAPQANGLFLGDYMGLSSAGDDFISFFTQSSEEDRASAFARRIVFDRILDPRSAGFWKHQARVMISGRGRAHESEAALMEYLQGIRAIHDLFDDVRSITDLHGVLEPPAPPSMRQRGRRQLMALLLNLTSGRLSPFLQTSEGESVVEAVDRIVETIGDPSAGTEEIEMAKDLAEAINEGAVSLH